MALNNGKLCLSLSEVRDASQAIAGVLKKRFSNLTAEELMRLSMDTLTAGVEAIDSHRG